MGEGGTVSCLKTLSEGNLRSTFHVGFRFSETSTRLTAVVSIRMTMVLFSVNKLPFNLQKKSYNRMQFGLQLQPAPPPNTMSICCYESIPRQSSEFYLWFPQNVSDLTSKNLWWIGSFENPNLVRISVFFNLLLFRTSHFCKVKDT